MIGLLLRFILATLRLLPMRLVFALGSALGLLAWALAAPYRRLARANLRIAFPDRPEQEIRALARRHFQLLGANLLAGGRSIPMSDAEIREVLEVEGEAEFLALLAEGRGAVVVLCHMGCWEMCARLAGLLTPYKFGTIYQPLRDPGAEQLVRELRSAHRVELFSRKEGFGGPSAFVRGGGGLTILADQHAGDAGVWAPFFGRLASTTTLTALLAQRTDAPLLTLSIRTLGPGRWRAVFSRPLERVPGESVEALTARINAAIEGQIRASPADWFWVHNRWKTPKPNFLLAGYRRGVTLPAGMSASDLQPFRLLVRSPNWLGDAVMSVPAVRSLATGRPDAQVTVLAPAKLADFWRTVPEVAQVLEIAPDKGGVFSVGKMLRQAGKFDVAVLLPNSLRSALEVWLGRIPRRVGFAGHSRRKLLNQVVPEPEVKPGPTRPHHAERYLHLARACGGMRPSEQTAEGTTLQPGFARIGLCPGAEYGPAKRWFTERFAEAAKQIAARKHVRFVLFGVAKDAPLGAEIATALEGLECENLIGQTSLAELIGQLRRCDLLLTNDTGTMHLAAHLGVPLVAVFGSTDPVATGPLSPRARVLRHQVECSPCFLRECPLDLRCMKAVTAEEVAGAALEMLG
ncbi:MAG: lipopolysaccharide heptosyltransferase II [Verrucomicrobia bacterium]|nr:lipopolysaccharide heptosyltransferase II [Verrucomicrobiota bacterium]